MSNSIDKRIDEIVKGLGGALEVAESHQKEVDSVIRELGKISEYLAEEAVNLKSTVKREIQSSVKNEIQTSLETSTDRVFKQLLMKFKSADQSASQAADIYQKSAKNVSVQWKIHSGKLPLWLH